LKFIFPVFTSVFLTLQSSVSHCFSASYRTGVAAWVGKVGDLPFALCVLGAGVWAGRKKAWVRGRATAILAFASPTPAVLAGWCSSFFSSLSSPCGGSLRENPRLSSYGRRTPPPQGERFRRPARVSFCSLRLFVPTGSFVCLESFLAPRPVLSADFLCAVLLTEGVLSLRAALHASLMPHGALPLLSVIIAVGGFVLGCRSPALCAGALVP